MNILHFRS